MPRVLPFLASILMSSIAVASASEGASGNAVVFFRIDGEVVSPAVTDPEEVGGFSVHVVGATRLAYGAPWRISYRTTGAQGPFTERLVGDLPSSVSTRTPFSLDGTAPSGRYGPLTLEVVDEATGRTASVAFDVEVAEASVPLVVHPATARDLTIRASSSSGIDASFIVDGGLAPYAFEAPTGLPSGVTSSFDGTTATITGHHATPGRYGPFSMSFRDVAGTRRVEDFSIDVVSRLAVTSKATHVVPGPDEWNVLLPVTGGLAPFTGRQLVDSLNGGNVPALTLTGVDDGILLTGGTHPGYFRNQKIEATDTFGDKASTIEFEAHVLNGTGPLVGWGDASYGQLGVSGPVGGSISPHTRLPLAASTGNVSGRMSALSSADYHHCGLADGVGYCWGWDLDGQMGNGSGPSNREPRPVTMPRRADGTMIPFESISSGGSSSCAVDVDGAVWCWGDNGYGQLAYNASGGQARHSPTRRIDAVAGSSSRVSVGRRHICTVSREGAAFCSGSNSAGQMGTGSTGSNVNAPVAVDMSEAGAFTEISTGLEFTCALDVEGAAWCWGANGVGQLGNGTTTASYRPSRVDISASGPFASISSGSTHSCAVTSAGDAWCWGSNFNGLLGNGNTSNGGFSSPTRLVQTRTGPIASVSASRDASCAVATDGRGYCWGSGNSGRGGNAMGAGAYRSPQLVGGTSVPLRFETISMGYTSGMGVTR